MILEGVHDKNIFKAVFLIGSPGSGKTFIYNKIINDGTFKVVNPDRFYEFLMRKHKTPMKNIPQSFKDKADSSLNKSFTLADKQTDFIINGKLPVVIDRTGASYDKTILLKNKLEDMGYDCIAIFVKTSLSTALKRNSERERAVPDDYLVQTHRKINDNAYLRDGAYVDEFENFIEINNDGIDNAYLMLKYKEFYRWLKKPLSSKAISWMKNFNKSIF